MLHGHVTGWALLIILFIVAGILAKKGNEKGTKVVQMIMRVLYLVVIATGVGIIFSANYGSLIAPLTTKIVLAIVLIGLMEMTIPKMKRGENTGLFWVLSFVIFGVILYLGYNVLPLTF
ncbi:DUF1516 family protein [Massilibacterium senegalense]|uniref:DUF1516 family protein n=1 Tax=Massilibacterium senegalense TaxID=1632858 RepID=UPI0007855808|nr:SirB2 family protein [Massilibacterium senegalense]